MDDAVKPIRKRNKNPDRVLISAEALEHVNVWKAQVADQVPGVKITRNDLVNFIILTHPDALSVPELKALEGKYFDQVKLAEWAIEELKRALGRGEKDPRILDIIAERSSSSGIKLRVKKVKVETIENTQKLEKTPQKQSLFTEKESQNSIVNSEE